MIYPVDRAVIHLSNNPGQICYYLLCWQSSVPVLPVLNVYQLYTSNLQKFPVRNFWNFRKRGAFHSIIPFNQMKRNILGGNFLKFGYTSLGCPPQRPENATFVVANFRKFKPQFFIEWKQPEDNLLRFITNFSEISYGNFSSIRFFFSNFRNFLMGASSGRNDVNSFCFNTELVKLLFNNLYGVS